jgi:3-deoxy-D-manno-oct-2-ulosonic acid (Kdo) hydroxylase
MSALNLSEVIQELPDSDWLHGATRDVEPLVESGKVLRFAQLPFVLKANEQGFLDEKYADPAAKNISVRWPSAQQTKPTAQQAKPSAQQAKPIAQQAKQSELKGAIGSDEDCAALHAMIARYAEQAEALVLRLFPHYQGKLKRGNSSFRPAQIAGRVTSWRQDDSRLHVDAFPSNPTQGTRLLRVFSNVNAHGEPRCWRVGEPFEAHARRYLPSIARPLPGSAWLLHKLHITKKRRTPYDHYMLQLHDRAKADADFQKTSPQLAVDFAPGTTWVVYSDQVLHAVHSGQHMMEQTFYLQVEDLQQPELSPLRTLERIAGRALR